MPGQTIRVGVVGAGANTRLKHIPGLQAIEGVEVVAVCNRSVASGERVADAFGISRVETDPEALFADADIDAICIGTWPYRHRDFAVRALEAGKHVLCEARMAMDAAEAREMLAAARARPELVAQIVPAPFDLRSWRTIRRVLADGTLGTLREVHVTAMNGNALDASTPLHWRERREYSGTNTMNLGMLAEAINRWMGPTERVFADAATFVPARVDADTGQMTRIDVPDSVGVLAQMPGGIRATYRLSTVLRAAGETNGIALCGNAGTLHWSPKDTMTIALGGEAPALLEPDAGTEGSWRVEQDFIDAIRLETPVELTSFEDGLRYMQFTEAVWRSWSEQRPVEVASV